MAELNKIICGGVSILNTGVGSCNLHIAPESIVMVPRGKRFTKAEVAVMAATLVAAAKADLKKDRIYPLGVGFENFAPNESEAREETFDSGRVITLGENPMTHEIGYYTNGICLHNAMRSFNGDASSWSFLYLDFSQKMVIGTKIDGLFAGIPLENYFASSQTPQTFSATAKYKFVLSFKPKYFNEGIAVIADVDGLDTLKGLNTAVLEEAQTLQTGVLKVFVEDACFKAINLADEYATQLAVPANWIVTNVLTGNAITITAVSVVSVGGKNGFSITVDTADTDYPANNGYVNVSLALPSVLEAAGVLNYEGTSLKVQRTV